MDFMSMNGPETQGPQYGPNESQYIPPLETWPPQQPMQAQQTPMASGWQYHDPHGTLSPYGGQPTDVPVLPQIEKRSVVVPWIFVGIGVLIPLSALVVGIWAMIQARHEVDKRFHAIAAVAMGLFTLHMLPLIAIIAS
jgi:hypothetical protein